jgi:hypothetical protein
MANWNWLDEEGIITNYTTGSPNNHKYAHMAYLKIEDKRDIYLCIF